MLDQWIQVLLWSLKFGKTKNAKMRMNSINFQKKKEKILTALFLQSILNKKFNSVSTETVVDPENSKSILL